MFKYIFLKISLSSSFALASASGGVGQQLKTTPDYYGAEPVVECLENYECPKITNKETLKAIKEADFTGPKLDNIVYGSHQNLSVDHMIEVKNKVENVLRKYAQSGLNLKLPEPFKIYVFRVYQFTEPQPKAIQDYIDDAEAKIDYIYDSFNPNLLGLNVHVKEDSIERIFTNYLDENIQLHENKITPKTQLMQLPSYKSLPTLNEYIVIKDKIEKAVERIQKNKPALRLQADLNVDIYKNRKWLRYINPLGNSINIGFDSSVSEIEEKILSRMK
jgi:hypothetical protein